ncbi:MAG: hypothetical protein R3C52_02240 [Hyphomonadaceae bacterium]
MNHRHRQILHAIFAHPEPANLSGTDVKAVLEELGAEIESRSGDRFAVSYKGHTAVFHEAHHSVEKEGLRQLRKFLVDQGVDPVTQYPL